jgi:hypothetical protein
MVAPSNVRGFEADDGDARHAALGRLSVAGAFAAMGIGAVLAAGSLLGGRLASGYQAAALSQGPAATTAVAGAAQPRAAGTTSAAASCYGEPQRPDQLAAPGLNAVTIGSVIARDTFGRRVVGGWGTADVGGRYVASGSRSEYAVNGTSGLQVTPTRGATKVSGLRVNTSAVDVLVRVSFNRYSSPGGENRARIIVRANTATDARTYDYEFAISAPDGKHTLEAWIMRRAARSDVGVGGDMDTGLVQQPGAWFWIRAEIWGSGPVHLRIKIWPAGSPEPAAWNVSAIDNHAPPQLRAGGYLLLSSYGNSGLPLKVRFDDLRAVRLRVAAGQASGLAVAGSAPDCSTSAPPR